MHPTPERADDRAEAPGGSAARAVIVIPTYNERENIGGLVARLAEAAPAAHVLVVDDNSPDGTGDLVRALPGFGERIHLLARAQKNGLGIAYQAGFGWALERGYGRIVQMDADFSHNPADVPRLLDAVARGADLAIGSRYVRGGGIVGWSTHRLLLSRSANTFARRMLGCPIHDLTGGFKCWRASALERISPRTLAGGGYIFQVECTIRALAAGLRVREVPIVFRERLAGASKMGLPIALEGFGWVVSRRWNGRRATP